MKLGRGRNAAAVAVAVTAVVAAAGAATVDPRGPDGFFRFGLAFFALFLHFRVLPQVSNQGGKDPCFIRRKPSPRDGGLWRSSMTGPIACSTWDDPRPRSVPISASLS